MNLEDMRKQHEALAKNEEYRRRMAQAQLDMLAGMAQSPHGLLAALMGQWDPYRFGESVTCTASRESGLISLEVPKRPLWDRVRDWLVAFLNQDKD